MIEVRLCSPRTRGHAGLTLVGAAHIVAMAIIAASQSRLMHARKRMGESSRRVVGSPCIRESTGVDQGCRDSESEQ